MTTGLPYRKDIDGLRFFAIVPVVLYHAFGDYIPSGFVGVDVFFAISGYLIGGIIYQEAAQGGFSFLNFYTRRARRILPALFVVILFTTIAGLLLLSTQEMSMLAGAAQWSVLGISNIFFYQHIDYFSPDASGNPLLMTWSLGIEEQFYIIFPIILLCLRSLRQRYRLLVLFFLIVLSLIVSVYLGLVNPLAGFYLLPARAWELGAGAALAIIHSEIPREGRPGASSDTLAGAGLAMVLLSCWLFSEATPFPGYAAILPISGTLLLLHTSGSRINRNFLTSPIFTGIGLISYSWYLWHWPLMAFVRVSAEGSPTTTAMVFVTLLSLCFAAGSWRFVEQPFRRGKLPPRNILPRYAVAIACLLLALGWIKHEDTFTAMRLPPEVLKIERVQSESFAVPDCMAKFGDTRLPDGPDCDPAGATVALLGDSHASHLRHGLRSYVEARGSKLLQITKASCAPLLGFSSVDRLSPNNLSECASFQRSAVNRIARDPSIRTVVLAAYLNLPGTSRHKIVGENFELVPAEVAFSRGTSEMAKVFQKSGKHVIVVLDVPKYDKNMYYKVLAEAIPLRHALGQATSKLKLPQSDVQATEPMRKLITDSVRDIPNVAVVDLVTQFCNADDCLYSENGLALYIDSQHLSVAGSRRVRWDGLLIDD